jgi:hypothetical protein
LPSKNLVSSFNIVNNTEYHVGFNTRAEEINVALYITEPACGILPPWSTQELVVTRVAKEEAPELEDMQCKDKYYVWSCFVTGDINASDIEEWMPITERKELPIIFTEVRFICNASVTKLFLFSLTHHHGMPEYCWIKNY